MTSKLLYSIIFITNLLATQSYVYPIMQDISDKSSSISSSYLDKLNSDANPVPNVKRLESVRKHITDYLKQQKDNFKLEKGFKSTYQPIPKTTFDTIFLNIYNISIIYMSYNMDRMIFEFKTGMKYVYYINDKNELEKMNQLIALIPHPIKQIIINDVKNMMDDAFGPLYCDPK